MFFDYILKHEDRFLLLLILQLLLRFINHSWWEKIHFFFSNNLMPLFKSITLLLQRFNALLIHAPFLRTINWDMKFLLDPRTSSVQWFIMLVWPSEYFLLSYLLGRFSHGFPCLELGCNFWGFKQWCFLLTRFKHFPLLCFQIVGQISILVYIRAQTWLDLLPTSLQLCDNILHPTRKMLKLKPPCFIHFLTM